MQLVCNEFHDEPSSVGHCRKLLPQIAQGKVWKKGMTKDISKYGKSCDGCQQCNKKKFRQRYAELQPLAIAKQPFNILQCIFIEGRFAQISRQRRNLNDLGLIYQKEFISYLQENDDSRAIHGDIRRLYGL
ncbi:hypothetical protein SOMG_01794 [Schizosaccharomyces osmophilus]|uniref:Integrase zinc-binding domain-containing protein n=1 Tax=Schizosaccharomyces osmophilus TaxID=2545709 RepID=A0AAE9WAD8_9SCHI|nr:uncharacterized protein SOMG_01794 [Schizosaccharomyces osmophilus]WBW71766.1 hypothetical protein SOMG_01794 [Schizosaccharomyces osmophilus]